MQRLGGLLEDGNLELVRGGFQTSMDRVYESMDTSANHSNIAFSRRGFGGITSVQYIGWMQLVRMLQYFKDF